MSNHKPKPQPSVETLLGIKSVQSVNYRLDRTSGFAWKPVRLTVFSDGSITEEIPFKEDMLDIVLRKLGFLMKKEGAEHFTQLKEAELKREAEAVRKANAI